MSPLRASRGRRWGISAAILLSGACWAGALNAGDVPHVAAVREGEKDPILQKIRRSFVGLTDEDPDVREEARRDLMGLTRKELPAFHRVLAEHLPLAPAETDVLHDIVQQIYLADFSYPTENAQGFLGVSFGYNAKFIEPPCGGVEILNRLPGFCAYRHFEDGDVVMAVGDPPNEVEPHTPDEMTRVVKVHSPGQKLTFKVFRRGRIQEVTLVLDARPLVADDLVGGINDLMAQRRIEADEYWERNFQPLVEGAGIR